MNRKGGVIAKIVLFFPSLLPILILLLVFIVGVVFLTSQGGLKAADFRSYNDGFYIGDLLIEKINVKLNGAEEQMTVFDAYTLYFNDKIEKKDMSAGMYSLLDANTPCIYLAIGESPGPAGTKGGPAGNDFYLSWNNGEPLSGHIGTTPLATGRALEKVKFTQRDFVFPEGDERKTVYVQYYRGGCY
jgi:hypothetical protein